MTCHKMGRYPIWTMGFGTSSASRIRKPWPPQKRPTFIRTVSPNEESVTQNPSAGELKSWVHLHRWYRNHELAVPLTDVGILFHDLFLVIAGQNQQVVGLGLPDAIR